MTLRMKFLFLLTSLSACGEVEMRMPTPTPMPDTAFTLQVMHVSDMDSGGDLVTHSKGISALLNRFRSELPNSSVFLSSGDNFIPGPFFNASDDASLTEELGVPSAGRGDIAILNAMGLQASALGNHEFDLGTRMLSDLIRPSGAWPGTGFPYLSSNLDFAPDANLAPIAAAENSGQDAPTLKGKIAKYTVLNVDGQRIGVVGATTPTLPNITTVNGVLVKPAAPNMGDMDLLAAQIQPSIDALTAQGINKIMLLTHMQKIMVEKALAPRLRDVDLIIAGGSNTSLFDSTDYVRPGDENGGPYPLSFRSGKGEPVLIVNVAADYKYLGRIVLPFDANGLIITEKLDPQKNGAWASDSEGLRRAGLTIADAMPAVTAIADKIQAVIAAKDANLFGAASVYLEGDRALVRNQETNLGSLSSDANLAWAQTLEPMTALSLKNGGGLRSSIGSIDAPAGATSGGVKTRTAANPGTGKQAGDISQLDIEFSLKFNNSLSLLTLTATELKAALEHGVSDWTPTSTQGKFPQLAGVRFSFDPTQAVGSRVRTIVIDDPDGKGPATGPQVVYAGGAFKVAGTTPYRMVTLEFLAGGGDAYPLSALSAPNRVDLVAAGATKTFTTVGAEQHAFAQYLKASYGRAAPYGVADTAAAQDDRIQNLSLRSDGLPQN